MSAPRRSTKAYRGAHTVAPQRRFRLGATFVPDPEPELPAGTLVGAQERYRLEGFLGQGGMGRVYAARRVRDDRRAAVKLLRADRVGDNASELTARFRQEGEAATRVGHRGIVETFGFERTPDGQVLLAMELLEGETLELWLARPGLLRDALVMLADICDALHAAHLAGVVHRDLKPANLFLHRNADGTVRPTILDFGLAKLSSSEHTQIETAAGTVLGTPYYLAPERALGKAVDARSDLYSVGVILYEVLVGALPFEDDNFMAIVEGHVRRTPLDPRQAAPDRKTPAPVAALTMALLSKSPAMRPQTAEEVAATLRALLDSEAEAISQCPTGPGQSVSVEADTLCVGKVAGWATTAPDDADPRFHAPTMIPRADMVATGSVTKPRRWPWMAAGGLAIVLGAGGVVLAGADEPAAGLAGTANAERAPETPAVETVAATSPATSPAIPVVVAEPTPPEPVVEHAVARPRETPATEPEPPVPPSSSKAHARGGTTRKARGPRTRPRAPENAAAPKEPALPAFKDKVYDEP